MLHFVFKLIIFYLGAVEMFANICCFQINELLFHFPFLPGTNTIKLILPNNTAVKLRQDFDTLLKAKNEFSSAR